MFGKPGGSKVYKISWRTKTDMNEVEWNQYQSLSAAQKELVVPLLAFYKLKDGNSVLAQARAKPINHSTSKETTLALRIMNAVGVNDHVARNFGYYQGQLRILDIDSPTAQPPPPLITNHGCPGKR